MLRKVQNSLSYMVVASEISHVFCCVIPTIFSLVSLLAGVGLISAMPAGFAKFHSFIHGYEIPIIITSGVVVCLSWALYLYSKRIDCHDNGCHHEPCDKKKDRSQKILIIGTVLFITNVVIYVGIHRNPALFAYIASHSSVYAQKHRRDHNHHDHEGTHEAHQEHQ